MTKKKLALEVIERLKKEYTDKENILFFDLNDIDASTTIVNDSLKDLSHLKKIAQAGFEVASKNHTWTNIATIILNSIKDN